MIRVLAGLPRWLSVTLALMAAGGLFVIPQISPGFHGWKLAVTLALGVTFTATAVGLPLLDTWQSQQEARFRVRVELEPELAIPAYTDDQNVISSLVSAERSACLSSLPEEKPKPFTPIRLVSTPVTAGDNETNRNYRVEKTGMSLAEYQRLLKRKDDGAELTAEEENIVERASKMFSDVVQSTTFSALRRPETRTPDQYREEVQQHLLEYSDFLLEHLGWEYAKRGIGRLRITLANPTDQVFEDVELEIYLPGKVIAISPKLLSEPNLTGPSRPRPYGTAAPLFHPGLSSLLAHDCFLPPAAASFGLPTGPQIDNSQSAKVTYPAVRLRPHAQVLLDDIDLVVREAPGTVISGTWHATATNAQGRASGTLTIRTAQPLHVAELLAAFMTED